MLNGVSHLFMMKADVLNIMKEIHVCTHYKLANGDQIDTVPYDVVDQTLKPIYKTLKGWQKSLEGINSFEAMPAELLEYIEFIQSELGVSISIVSIGPDRSQTIVKQNQFTFDSI